MRREFVIVMDRLHGIELLGFRAGREGVPSWECPYSRGWRQRYWLNGYKRGQWERERKGMLFLMPG